MTRVNETKKEIGVRQTPEGAACWKAERSESRKHVWFSLAEQGNRNPSNA